MAICSTLVRVADYWTRDHLLYISGANARLSEPNNLVNKQCMRIICVLQYSKSEIK